MTTTMTTPTTNFAEFQTVVSSPHLFYPPVSPLTVAECSKTFTEFEKCFRKVNEPLDSLKERESYFYFINTCTRKNALCIQYPPNSGNIISTDIYFYTAFDSPFKVPNLFCNYYFVEQDIIVTLSLGTAQLSMITMLFNVISFKEKIRYHFPNYHSRNFAVDYPVEFAKIVEYKNQYIMQTSSAKVFEVSSMTPKTTFVYGFMQNYAHNMFNEITGIYVLKQNGVFENVDEFILGPLDPFYMRDYFVELAARTGSKITYETNVYHYCGRYGRGFCFKYNHLFITEKCCNEMIHRPLLIKYPLAQETRLELNRIILRHNQIYNLTLRCGEYRKFRNQTEFFVKLILRILEEEPTAFFFFDGFCNTPFLADDVFISWNGETGGDLEQKYRKLVEDIVAGVKAAAPPCARFCYKSLIGMYSPELIEHINCADRSIQVIGAGAYTSRWICNKPTIYFGLKRIHETAHLDIQSRENVAPLQFFVDRSMIQFENGDDIEHDDFSIVNYDYCINFIHGDVSPLTP